MREKPVPNSHDPARCHTRGCPLPAVYAVRITPGENIGHHCAAHADALTVFLHRRVVVWEPIRQEEMA